MFTFTLKSRSISVAPRMTTSSMLTAVPAFHGLAPVGGNLDVVGVLGDGLDGTEVEGLDVHELLDVAFLEQVDEIARDPAPGRSYP